MLIYLIFLFVPVDSLLFSSCFFVWHTIAQWLYLDTALSHGAAFHTHLQPLLNFSFYTLYISIIDIFLQLKVKKMIGYPEG